MSPVIGIFMERQHAENAVAYTIPIEQNLIDAIVNSNGRIWRDTSQGGPCLKALKVTKYNVF